MRKFVSTITSPLFSEIVIVFSEQEVLSPPLGLARWLSKVYKVKEFRLAFCLEAAERTRAVYLRSLRLATQLEVDTGFYNFLPHPPVVFSRTLAKYNHP